MTLAARWDALLARVNAMTLRERLLLFAAVATVLGVLTNELFIAPLVRLQRQQAALIEKRSEEMESQRARIESDLVERRRARAAELRDENARVQAQIDAIEREIATVGSAGDLASLRAGLNQALRKSEKVTLLRVASAEGAAAPAPGTAPQASGLDITLGGGYLDLMEYLAAVEAALPQARWRALRVTAETVPAQATVSIVTPRTGP